jgi:hypothetical protein
VTRVSRPIARSNDDWAPSTIRAILSRELYRGVIVWNKTKKRDDWGMVKQKARPESEWRREKAEHLRLIPDALWLRVRARRQETEGRAARFTSGRLSGRPPKTPTANLLSGLATCGICGGGFTITTGPRKRGRQPEYVCYRRRQNGTCQNELRMPVAEMNEQILQHVEEHALTPEAVELVINLSEREDATELQAKLARERKDVEKRIGRLVAAIEAGGDAASLVAKVRELEARKAAISTEVACLRPIPASRAGGRGGEASRVATAVASIDDDGPNGSPADPARAADVHAEGQSDHGGG